jgi:hypothetical protein
LQHPAHFNARNVTLAGAPPEGISRLSPLHKPAESGVATAIDRAPRARLLQTRKVQRIVWALWSGESFFLVFQRSFAGGKNHFPLRIGRNEPSSTPTSAVMRSLVSVLRAVNSAAFFFGSIARLRISSGSS